MIEDVCYGDACPGPSTSESTVASAGFIATQIRPYAKEFSAAVKSVLPYPVCEIDDTGVLVLFHFLTACIFYLLCSIKPCKTSRELLDRRILHDAFTKIKELEIQQERLLSQAEGAKRSQQLQNRCDHLDDENRELRSTLDALERSLHDATSKLLVNESENATLHASLEKSVNGKENAEREVRKLFEQSKRAESTITDLERRHAQVQNELEECQWKCADLNHQLDDCSRQKTNLQHNLDAASRNAMILEEQLEESRRCEEEQKELINDLYLKLTGDAVNPWQELKSKYATGDARRLSDTSTKSTASTKNLVSTAFAQLNLVEKERNELRHLLAEERRNREALQTSLDQLRHNLTEKDSALVESSKQRKAWEDKVLALEAEKRQLMVTIKEQTVMISSLAEEKEKYHDQRIDVSEVMARNRELELRIQEIEKERRRNEARYYQDQMSYKAKISRLESSIANHSVSSNSSDRGISSLHEGSTVASLWSNVDPTPIVPDTSMYLDSKADDHRHPEHRRRSRSRSRSRTGVSDRSSPYHSSFTFQDEPVRRVPVRRNSGLLPPHVPGHDCLSSDNSDPRPSSRNRPAAEVKLYRPAAPSSRK